MGAAFSSLFGRDFVVGFFLPAAIFILLLTGIAALVVTTMPPAMLPAGFASKLTWTEIKSTASDTSLTWLLGSLFVVAWAVAVVLSSVKNQVFRFFEGYDDRGNPLRWFKFLQRRRLAELSKATAVYKENDKAYDKALQALASEFPEDFESDGLGTRFGNIVRAAEVYPRVMYGLEGIEGWRRLAAVIPKDYFAFINEARSQIELCINMALILWICIFEYLILCGVIYRLDFKHYPWPLVPVALLIWAWVANRSAARAARDWGEWIKAAFDVYLGDLRAKLNFDPYDNPDMERERWLAYSQAIIFRSEKRMPRPTPVEPEESDDQAPTRRQGLWAWICDRVFGVSARPE